MNALYFEKVQNVRHWTDTLFSFTCTRPSAFRFLNGQFTMLGLSINGKPLMRAYSMVSANYDNYLEFLSIKVPNGPLTSYLKEIKVGDSILIGKKATGTLLIDNLKPGKRLWLIATGTGLAPFLSIIKDPTIYENFDYVVLTHTCRYLNELAYRSFIETLDQHEYLGEFVRSKLIYIPTVTRENFHIRGRITDLVRNRCLFEEVKKKTGNMKFETKFDVQDDRVMICGTASFAKEFIGLLPHEFQEGRANYRGHYVIERAFLE